MNKTNNNLINCALGIMGFSILSVMFVIPMHANAGFYSSSSGIAMSATTPATTTTPTYAQTSTPAPAAAPAVNPVPVVYSINPSSVVTNSSSKTITITGANFVPGSVARFNSEDRATTFISSEKLAMTLTSSDMAGVGAYSVTVLNPVPGGGMSNAALFHLNKQAATATTTTKKTSTACTTSTGAGLSASALFGSNGLMPTTFTQWLLLLILILLVVVLGRKAFAEKKPDPHQAAHA